MPTIGLILPSAGFRTSDFISAARRLRADLVVVSDEHQLLASPDEFLRVDLTDAQRSAARVATAFPHLDAIVAADEAGVELSAHIGKALGLPHNPVEAAKASRDKATQRRLWREKGLDQPDFEVIQTTSVITTKLPFPLVIKPIDRSASQGVIRVNDLAQLSTAHERIKTIVGADATLIIETFLDGSEVAVEGLMLGGVLTPLAIFDKPDPMDGPYFAETLLISPSRLAPHIQRRVTAAAADACTALGLREGPIHVEFRIGDDGIPRLLELAARPIGGLCGRAIRFSVLSAPLEEVLLRAALGRPLGSIEPSALATGVHMLNADQTGRYIGTVGIEEALQIPGILNVDMTAAPGATVTALPDGGSYLGFVFARAATSHQVEHALRTAAARLTITIDTSPT